MKNCNREKKMKIIAVPKLRLSSMNAQTEKNKCTEFLNYVYVLFADKDFLAHYFLFAGGFVRSSDSITNNQ